MDKELIANIKSLGLDMINEAGSGHPGIVLSSAPIIYSLYANHLNIKPNTNWFNRDRFIMSAGHGSALLYSTLFMSGFNFTIDDLKSFRKLNSKTPGHPEISIPGVECSTGPLGQGIATSIGIALGEKILNSRYPFINFKTYVLVSDGDLMEGVSYEACSLAGSLNLNNLIILYDSNNMTLDGPTDNTFKENVRERFKTMGFNTYLVKDGNDLKELNEEINKAKKSDKPVLIEIKTKLGYGSLLENTNKVHGKPLTDDDLKQLKNKLGINHTPFYVNEIARNEMIKKINDRVSTIYNKSIEDYKTYVNNELNGDESKISFLFNKYNYNINNFNFSLPKETESLRVTNQKIMETISNYMPIFIGGSADLNSSTKAYLANKFDITSTNYSGSNIWFGIREHAMGSILNGLALLNFRPFGSTFLSFADYQKPAIRMSSLMSLPVIYIYTHDSIVIGQDGPTHQPVEQLSMLRSTPNLDVYRPSDAKELVGSYQSIMANYKPSALILSKTDVIQKNTTDINNTTKGAYILKDSPNIDGIIIATGTEVDTVLKISEEIPNLRIISMPSKEVFKRQSIDYQHAILPQDKKKVVVEASSSYGWYDIADYVIGVDNYGVSAPSNDVLKYMKFDYDSIKEKIIEILNR